MLDRLAVLNMQAAEATARRIREAPPDADIASSVLGLARASRAVAQLITASKRLEAGSLGRPERPADRASRPASTDPRRAIARATLHKAAAIEPDRALRAQLRQMIDERLDEELDADPESEIRLGDIVIAISGEFGLGLRVSELTDEELGIPRPPMPGNDIPYADRPCLYARFTDFDPPDTGPPPSPSPAGGRGPG